MFKRLSIKLACIICLALVVASCSTKKAKWTNVAYHNTTTHYNIWFNGNESLKEGVAQLEKTVVDDYTQLLPVFKVGTKEEAMTVYPQMDRAMEKGVKGIKKHSIYLKGKEHVPYIPECYLLTAYATFYKHDYATTINTCRIMKTQYAGTHAADEASILLGRALAASEQATEGESVLDQLVTDLGKGNFSNNLKTTLYMAMADVALQQEKYKKGVQYIKLAIAEKPSRAQKARLNFILGQVYQRLEKRPVASKYYNECLSSSPDYVMEFNARISLAACADLKHTDVVKLERDLDRMLNDKKNEEYHDQIYYAKGEMFIGVHNQKKAIQNFCQSVAVSTTNKAQKAKSALRAAEVYYDHFENYDAAQRYYDTAMAIINADYPNYSEIRVRYEMLTELTNNTRLIATNDSLLRVANMSDSERQKFIQNLIAQKKKEEEEARNRELAAQFTAEAKAQQNTLTGDWYFYNSNNVQKGKETFQQRWGTRLLEDYWFLSKKNSMGMGNLIAGVDQPSDDIDEDQPTDSTTTSKGNATDPYSIAYYEKGLPTEASQQDSMSRATAEALFNAGYLYYDAIRNNDSALSCYLRLATDYPSYPHIEQAFYMLYKIYDRQGNTPQANYYRDMVLMGFPDSDFANLIRDDRYYQEIARRDLLLQGQYDDLYTTFRRHRYKEVVAQARAIAAEYPEDHLLPKFHYWEALSHHQLGNNNEAIKVFNDILASVPSTDSIVPLVKQQLALLKDDKGLTQTTPSQQPDEEEITAEDLNKLKKPSSVTQQAQQEDEPELSSEAQMFRYRDNMQHYVIVLIDDRKIRATEIQTRITDFNTKYYGNTGLRVNPLMFTDTTQILTIHRFKNAQEAVDYTTHLLLDDSPLRQYNATDYTVYPISTQNYTTFYSRKNLAAYREFYERYYKK